MKKQWENWNGWARAKRSPQSLSDTTKYFLQDYVTYEIENLTDEIAENLNTNLYLIKGGKGKGKGSYEDSKGKGKELRAWNAEPAASGPGDSMQDDEAGQIRSERAGGHFDDEEDEDDGMEGLFNDGYAGSA
eukprot:4027552-Alexandrium_andersonii.AAC.1